MFVNESEGLQRVQRTDTISGESVLLIIRVMLVVSRHQSGYIITELGGKCAAWTNPEQKMTQPSLFGSGLIMLNL